MRHSLFAVGIAVCTLASPAWAEDDYGPLAPLAPLASQEHYGPSLAEPQITPEMWMYMQTRRDQLDPHLAIRARAAFQAEQRQRRIAARQWYGLSSARPTVSPVPYIGTEYSPGWQTNLLQPQPVRTVTESEPSYHSNLPPMTPSMGYRPE